MAKKIRIIPWLDESQLNKQLNDIGKRQQKIKVDIDNGDISNANQKLQQMNKTVTNSNSIFGKLKNTIGNTFSTGKIAMTGYLMVLNEINKAGQNAKQTIQEIDKAITDLSIATNQSRETVSRLVKDYNTYAKQLRSTTTQVTSAADDYLRAGKSMSEAQALIKDSIMLSKLGQLDSSTATNDLLATMNGYSMSIEELERALDAMVAIDMEASTSSGEIATALKYCASSADVAGLSFNKLAAMIGAVQDKTQQSAETIGTFFNTLLSRYRDVKIGRFVDDDGESLSDVESVLGSLNIKLRDSKEEFRDFETVIDEVAQSWDSYSSVQQAAIAKAFSGTRQQNRFIALMEGYNKTLELTEVAANSAGTAVEKFNSAYMNSLEAKQNVLQASFESMVINSDFDEIYSGILDATTALVEFVNQANVLKGVFAGLTVSSGIKFFLAAKTGATEAYISLNKFANALDIVKQTNISTSDFDKLLLLSNGLSASQMKLLLSSKQLSMAQKEQILINSGLSSEEAKLQLQTWGMVTAQTGLTAATTTLGNAFKGLMASMAANPIMLATLAVSGAVMAYQSYNQKLEETRQKNIEASEAAIEHAKSLQDLYNEYNRLSSVQNRTTTEEEDFKTAVEGITKALGDKAEVLEGLTAGTNEYADALAKATSEELQSASVNATVGRKSAEEKLQGNIWSDWSGSKVSVDSNSKGKALSEEAQKAVDIVSDSLNEFEIINRTWNNISWDISSNDPKEALEYYNALIKAREELVLASENDEALLDTEVYKDMNVAINAMSESLDSYIEKLYEEEKLLYMSQNSIPSTTEEYKAMEEVMVNVAGSSVDLQEKFKELLTTDFASLVVDVENVGSAVEDVVNATAAMNPDLTASASKIIDQLNAQLKPAFDSLKSAYKDIFSDDGFNLDAVDIPMLESIKSDIEELNNLEDVDISINMDDFNDFAKILTDVNTTEAQAHQAFDDLATSIFNATTATEGMTDETVQLVEQLLESLGVVNATEVAEQALMESKAQTVLATYDLINATENEYVAILAEGEAAGVTRQAIYSLMAAEIAFGQNDLSVEQKIAKLHDLATAYGDTASAALATAIANDLASGHTDVDTAINDLMAKINAGINKVDIDFGNIGGGTSGASKAGSSAGDAYVDAFEDELSHLQDLRDRGVIDEAEYLNRLRELYTRYFADRKEYLDQFQKYERQYLEGKHTCPLLQ